MLRVRAGREDGRLRAEEKKENPQGADDACGRGGQSAEGMCGFVPVRVGGGERAESEGAASQGTYSKARER